MGQFCTIRFCSKAHRNRFFITSWFNTIFVQLVSTVVSNTVSNHTGVSSIAISSDVWCWYFNLRRQACKTNVTNLSTSLSGSFYSIKVFHRSDEPSGFVSLIIISLVTSHYWLRNKHLSHFPRHILSSAYHTLSLSFSLSFFVKAWESLLSDQGSFKFFTEEFPITSIAHPSLFLPCKWFFLYSLSILAFSYSLLVNSQLSFGCSFAMNVCLLDGCNFDF